MSRSSSKPLSQRQLRVGELVRKVISDILFKHDLMDDQLSGAMIMVNEVRMSPDLKLATAYISEINADQQLLEKRAKALSKHSKFFRKVLGGELAMKYTPEIRFRADTTSFVGNKIDNLLASEKVRRDVEKTVSDQEDNA